MHPPLEHAASNKAKLRRSVTRCVGFGSVQLRAFLRIFAQGRTVLDHRLLYESNLVSVLARVGYGPRRKRP